MGIKLPPKDIELYNTIDKILYKEWDPIGVAGIKEAREEYYSYLAHIFSLVKQHANAKEIAEYLHWVVNERMGMNSNLEHHLPYAEKIIAVAKNTFN